MFVIQGGVVQALSCSDTVNPGDDLQAAIDAAADGDTVCLGVGIHTTSIVFGAAFTTDNLTIIGKNKNNRPVITGGVRFLNTATNDIDDLTIANLYIKGEAAGGDGVIDMDNGGEVNNLWLNNNVIDGEDADLVCVGGFGIGRHGILGNNLGGNLTVTGNEFKDILGWSVFDSNSGGGGDGDLHFDTITFDDNYIHDSNGSVSFRGLSTDRTDLVHVKGNRWDNIGNNNSCTGQNWAAIEVNQALTVHVVNNVVNDVEKGCFDPPACTAAEGQGFQFHNSIATLNVTGNHLTNIEQYGIWVAPVGGFTAYPSGAIAYNQIDTGGMFGIFALNAACCAPTGPDLNAECNWWGASDGPSGAGAGSGDPVSTNVDFDPFLTTKGKMKGNCP